LSKEEMLANMQARMMSMMGGDSALPAAAPAPAAPAPEAKSPEEMTAAMNAKMMEMMGAIQEQSADELLLHQLLADTGGAPSPGAAGVNTRMLGMLSGMRAGSGGAHVQAAPASGLPARRFKKSKICTNWQSGHCPRGDLCNFAHGEDQLGSFQPQAGGDVFAKQAAQGLPHWGGDWTCPTCGDLVFGSKTTCRKCQTPRPQGGDEQYQLGSKFGSDQQQMMMAMMQGGQMEAHAQGAESLRANAQQKMMAMMAAGTMGSGSTSKGGGKGGNQAARAGDWHCPGCGDLVFAFRDRCKSCNTAKPSGGASSDASGADNALLAMLAQHQGLY